MNDTCVSKSIETFFKCRLLQEVIAKILLLKSIKTSMLKGGPTVVWSCRKLDVNFPGWSF